MLVTICPGDDDKYRFGYNGQEKVNEWSGLGNYLDMGARGLDTRIGRTLTPDPAFKEYPYLSPYVFVADNPTNATDPDGKRFYFVAGAGNDQQGWNYVNRFSRILTDKNIRGFTRVDVSHDDPAKVRAGKTPIQDILFTSTFRDSRYRRSSSDVPFTSLYKQDRQLDRAFNGVMYDIKKRPLEKGEQLNLAGYSYGSVMQAHLALKLADAGIKVDNLILIGSPISDKSSLYQTLERYKKEGKIGNIIRYDIPGDKLSNPQSEKAFIEGGIQNSSDDGPHFDLARPGAEADKKIEQLGDKLKTEGVK